MFLFCRYFFQLLIHVFTHSLADLLIGKYACIFLGIIIIVYTPFFGFSWRQYDRLPGHKTPRPSHWSKESMYIQTLDSSFALESEMLELDVKHDCPVCWETKREMMALPCHHFLCLKWVGIFSLRPTAARPDAFSLLQVPQGSCSEKEICALSCLCVISRAKPDSVRSVFLSSSASNVAVLVSIERP